METVCPTELDDILRKTFDLAPLPLGNGGREAMTVAEWAPSLDITGHNKESMAC